MWFFVGMGVEVVGLYLFCSFIVDGGAVTLGLWEFF